MRCLVLVLALALGGCAFFGPGTSAQFAGQICGQDVQFTLQDNKDRGGFEVDAQCPQGGGIRITSSDSSFSQVIATQGQVIENLAGLVVGAAAP